jgi:hypothetical protein
MRKNYMTAIVICKAKGSQFAEGKKFHDIMNVESQIQKFLRFARSLGDAQYVNFYYKAENDAEKGQNFAFRRYLE